MRPVRTSPAPLAMLLGCAASVLAAGCAGPAIRSQSPEIEALADMEADTRLVGDYAMPWGLNALRVERAALITGLAGTGSDPAPGPQRQMLLTDMQERGVVEPNTLLASPATSLAWVHAYLPPGIRKGDRFDIHIEVPADSETTSLAGGWLMETRLTEMAVLGNAVREGRMLAMAEGPLLVDPVTNGTLDSVSRLRARVPGGGVSTTTRNIGLIVAPEHRSVAMSKRLGDCINRRFHAVVRGSKRGAATPKTDRYIELQIPAIYRHNLARYVKVVRCVAVIEPPGGRHARLELLARQLADAPPRADREGRRDPLRRGGGARLPRRIGGRPASGRRRRGDAQRPPCRPGRPRRARRRQRHRRPAVAARQPQRRDPLRRLPGPVADGSRHAAGEG
jgi:hypothetical protein